MSKWTQWSLIEIIRLLNQKNQNNNNLLFNNKLIKKGLLINHLKNNNLLPHNNCNNQVDIQSNNKVRIWLKSHLSDNTLHKKLYLHTDTSNHFLITKRVKLRAVTHHLSVNNQKHHSKEVRISSSWQQQRVIKFYRKVVNSNKQLCNLKVRNRRQVKDSALRCLRREEEPKI